MCYIVLNVQSISVFFSSDSINNLTLPVISGVSLTFAATVIVLLALVIHLWRRVKANGLNP